VGKEILQVERVEDARLIVTNEAKGRRND